MKSALVIIIVLAVSTPCIAQGTFYDHITFGDFGVGYCDTIIYDHSIRYQEYDYAGSAPIFANIWFPIDKSINRKTLTFGDFISDSTPLDLEKVYHNLTSHMDEIFIRDGITYNIETDEPIDYGQTDTRTILSRIKLMETKSVASQINSKVDFPIIVYHHGSQGLSTENAIMGEYFASKGFIFVAANYHLPYPNTLFGLLPFRLENKSRHQQTTPKAVIEFAKSLSNSNQLTFIGHSWGAQEGWCFLHDASLASSFVSLESTIEYKSDSTIIKDRWPLVWDAIKIQKNRFSIPILFVAAADENLNFNFFSNLSSEPMIFASYNKMFSHNSYTSLSMMRYFLNNEFKQPDSTTMLTQIQGYVAHLDLISAFLENEGKGVNLERFSDQFVISQD